MLHALAATLLLLQAQPPAAPAPRHTAVAVGRVLDSATGQPVAGAVVSIIGFPRGTPPRLMTDAQGRFVYRNLPPGSYELTAARPGYLTGFYGQRRHDGPGRRLELAEGERATDVTLMLWKHGAIGGTVVDETGQPMVGVTVRALEKSVAAGKVTWRPVGLSLASDDRGIYRVGSLPPGEYLVSVAAQSITVPTTVLDTYRASAGSDDPPRRALSSAMISLGGGVIATSGAAVAREGESTITLARGLALPNGDGLPSAVYPPTFHPGTTNLAQATIVRVRPGDDRLGVDIQMRPVPAVTVSGTVTGPQGPAAHVAVRLEAPETPRAFSLMGHGTVTDAGGRFTMVQIPAGEYTLSVTQMPPTPASNNRTTTVIESSGGATMSMISVGDGPPEPLSTEPTHWASLPLTVGRRDITGLQIALQEGARFTGHIEFDGTAKPPDADRLRRLSIYAWPADESTVSGNRPAQVETDGRFRTLGMPGGQYILRITGTLPGWTLRSATYEGRDIADRAVAVAGADINGIVVTFTDRPAEISGTVQISGRPDADASVVVFPSDSALWGATANSRRTRLTRVSRTGTFTVSGLPPGSYYVVAIPDEQAGGWNEPAALEAFARSATAIDLGEGAKQALNLRTVREARR